MKLVGIYKITSPSGRIYIGQSIDIRRRFRYYKNLKCKEQPKLYNSLLKYGVNAHKFEIIELCSVKYLNNVERYYQKKYDCVNSGLNMMYVRNDHFSGGHSEETKQKLREHFKGKPIPEQTRQALILSNKTRVLSEESLNKIRNAFKGKKHSKETIEAQRIRQTGSKRSEETKQKMSDSNPNKKPVIQYDLQMNYIAEYPSITQANKDLGVYYRATAISQCLGGGQKTAYGYIWRYKKC